MVDDAAVCYCNAVCIAPINSSATYNERLASALLGLAN